MWRPIHGRMPVVSEGIEEFFGCRDWKISAPMEESQP
jgi:hypothetical protein